MPVVLDRCLNSRLEASPAGPGPSAPSVGGDPFRPASVPARDLIVPQLRLAVEELYPASAARPDWCVFGVQINDTSAAILAAVTERGRAWVDPDALLYHSPHSLTAVPCLLLGTEGGAVTFTGDGAVGAALGYAALLIERKRAGHVLVGAVRPAGIALAVLRSDTGQWAGADGAHRLAVRWDGGMSDRADAAAERIFDLGGVRGAVPNGARSADGIIPVDLTGRSPVPNGSAR